MKITNKDEIKGLLFDLDGTLINSEKAFFQSFRDVLYDNFGIIITDLDYKKYELENNCMLLKTLRSNCNLFGDISDDEVMQLVYTDYLDKFKTVIQEDDVKENFELLKRLKSNYKLGLVTTCRRVYLDILFDELQLDDLFDVVIAREDVDNLKPAPDAYLAALKELDLDYSSCLAIEDSKRGINAANASGITTIKVDNYTMIKEYNKNTIEYKSVKDFLINEKFL